jgi:hypothetical protein
VIVTQFFHELQDATYQSRFILLTFLSAIVYHLFSYLLTFLKKTVLKEKESSYKRKTTPPY